MQKLLIFNFLCAVVSGQGKVPMGVYTGGPFRVDVGLVQDDCDNLLTCAGVTYQTGPNDDPDVHYHAFIPEISATNVSGWETYQSKKPFVYRAGELSGTQLLQQPIVKNATLDYVKSICLNDSNCVGFTYSTANILNQDIRAVASAILFSSIDSVIYDDEATTWRSFIVNDLKKAPSVNGSTLPYDEEQETVPYLSCCPKYDALTQTLPTIEELSAVDTLPRISCNISKEEFQIKYELTRTPVILVGCDDSWPARNRWNYESLIPRFDNSTTWRAQTESEDLDDTVKWSTISDSMVNNKTFYIFDQLDHPHGREVEKDYTTPPQFQNTDLYRNLVDFPGDYGTRRWFCVGTPHTGTMPHMDPLATDAWNSVLKGHKWWVLYPAASVDDEKPLTCNAGCSTENPGPVDWYASVGINAARTDFNDREGGRAIHVLQNPGETIYVPYGVVHSVLNMDHTMAVTANFGSAGNLYHVWKSVVEDGKEGHWQKMYYDVMTAEQREEVRQSFGYDDINELVEMLLEARDDGRTSSTEEEEEEEGEEEEESASE